MASSKLLQVMQLFLILLGILSVASEKLRCLKKEREALLAFKQDLQDDFDQLSSWSNKSENCCVWVGVTCSHATGHVTKLNLSRFGNTPLPLGGKISSALLELRELQVLDLSHIRVYLTPFPTISASTFPKLVHLNLAGTLLIESTIFPQLGNLSNLRYLDLSENFSFGDLVSDLFGSMCKLETLKLGSNNFTGLVPEFQGCVKDSLKILDLSSNQFFGSFPDITYLSSLEELYLDGNYLNGSFPDGFARPSGLVVLSVSGNQLTGSLPDLSLLPSLEKLLIHHNRLNGMIPESLGSLSKLQILDTSHNSFDGVMSEAHFKSLSKLLFLDLTFNSLALNLRSGWIPPFQLEVIKLRSCKLGPDFPNWLRTSTNFSWLDVSQTGISSAVPHWFWDLHSNFSLLNLSNNQMSGVLPYLTFKTTNFPTIDLSYNQFEGSLPMFPANVASLNLAGNRFSGSVTSLCGITDRALSFLDLSDNLFSGQVPDCVGQWPYLEVLNLSNNSLSGGIPWSMSELLQLGYLNLRDNSFSGDFPRAFHNHMFLMFLDLSNNMFSGEIPSWISEMSQLQFLSLQGNKFHGKIPFQICQINGMQILDLSRNNLSGRIPRCFSNFSIIARKPVLVGDAFRYGYWIIYMGKTVIKWKGREYKYGSSIEFFRIIDLAHNNLFGMIPKELMNLSELVVLNLSTNNLQGAIPENIGRMKQLQSLDLSENILSGSIPPGIVDLTFLSFLNLSHNNLSGRIPTGTQILTFNESAFVGNNALCGLPLLQKCPGDDAPNPPTHDWHGNVNNGEEEDEFWRWFYISMGTGFAISFWGVGASLLLKRSWRHAYFRFLDDLRDLFYVRFVLLRNKIKNTSYP